MARVESGIYVLFDGPPGPQSGRFIEVEDYAGKGLGLFGSGGAGWHQEREDLWVLGPFGKFDQHKRLAALEAAARVLSAALLQEASHDSEAWLAVEEAHAKLQSVLRKPESGQVPEDYRAQRGAL
jgi:hypothetical protein